MVQGMGVVCGTFMPSLAATLSPKLPGICQPGISPVPIILGFYGGFITWAGLITLLAIGD